MLASMVHLCATVRVILLSVTNSTLWTHMRDTLFASLGLTMPYPLRFAFFLVAHLAWLVVWLSCLPIVVMSSVLSIFNDWHFPQVTPVLPKQSFATVVVTSSVYPSPWVAVLYCCIARLWPSFLGVAWSALLLLSLSLAVEMQSTTTASAILRCMRT
jgi:hypothetical protein